MANLFECPVQAGEDAVFGAIADVLQTHKTSDTRLWAVKVSVNPSRFGIDEAISLRLRSSAGEAEIGKLIIRPLNGENHLLVVPENATGGAKPPELDPEGKYLHETIESLLIRLEQLNLYRPPSPPHDKEPIGFRRPD
ncbi:MAG: hypothetical protein IH861_05205 [Chloroflexi bacterium]|nr:hypothetical protein [Chloroflexota bacterium]